MLVKWIFYGTPVQFSNATESYWNLKTPRIPCRVVERESNEDRVVLRFQVQGIWTWVTAHTIPQGRSNLVISLRDEEKLGLLKQPWSDLVAELQGQGWRIEEVTDEPVNIQAPNNTTVEIDSVLTNDVQNIVLEAVENPALERLPMTETIVPIDIHAWAQANIDSETLEAIESAAREITAPIVPLLEAYASAVKLQDLHIETDPRLPQREADLRKWRVLWRKIRDKVITQGLNATDIAKDIQRDPREYENLPIAQRTLQDVIKAGEAGLLEE